MRILLDREYSQVTGSAWGVSWMIPDMGGMSRFVHKAVVYSATAGGGFLGGLVGSVGGFYLAFQAGYAKYGSLAIASSIFAGTVGAPLGFAGGAVASGVTAHYGYRVVDGVAGYLTADSDAS